MPLFAKRVKRQAGNFWYGLFPALVFAVLGLVSTGVCGAVETPAPSAPVTIRVGYVLDSFSGVSLEDARIAVRLLYESRFKNRYPQHRGEVTLFPDIHTAVDAVRKKKINGLGLSTVDYLKTQKENKLIPVRKAAMGDSARTRFVVLVRRDQATLNGLRNRTLLLEASGQGQVASMWLDTLLLERKLPETRRFFKTVENIDRESQAAMKVFFRKADVCVIQKSTYLVMKELNPQIGEKLHVLFESPDYMMGLFAVVKDLDEETKRVLLDFTDGLSLDREGDRILSMFRVKGISEFRPESIKTLEDLYRTWLMLKPKRK
jgi:ABC-type phosphate/phosphonate transport system substrate-binding protein